jgi:hypothetical protein
MRATHKIALAFFALVISAVPSSAWSADSLVGMWRVVSNTAEETESKAVHKFYGDNPSGYLIYTADGRWMQLITDSTRKPPAAPKATDAEAAQLWRTMAAEAGTYKTEGDKITGSVEVSSNPAFIGTKFSVSFEVNGDRFQYKAGPFMSGILGKEIVYTRVFERVK